MVNDLLQLAQQIGALPSTPSYVGETRLKLLSLRLCLLLISILSILLSASACAVPTQEMGSGPTSASPSEGVTPQGAAAVPDGSLWPKAALQVRAAFAQEFGLSPEEVKIAAAEPTQWENDCLGLPFPGEACGKGPLKGYRITLRIRSEDYVYHVDEAGQIIRPAQAPSASGESPLLIWTLEDPVGCTMALIGPSTVQFGPCSGVALQRPLSSAERETLQSWVARYTPFEMQTGAGFVQLAGRGTAQPSGEEAQQIAAWAKALAQIPQ